MVTTDLHSAQLYWNKLCGLQLSYSRNWRGYTMQFWALINVFSIFVGYCTHLHYAIFTGTNLEDFAEALSCWLANSESLFKYILFYMWRHKLQGLIEKQQNIIDTTRISHVHFFSQYTKIVNNLFIVFFSFATMTASLFTVESLFKNIFLSEREFLFKVR